MTLSALERRVLQAVDQEAVVSTTVDLIGFETTARVRGRPATRRSCSTTWASVPQQLELPWIPGSRRPRKYRPPDRSLRG